MSDDPRLRFVAGGDAGLYVCLGDEGIDEGVNARVHALAAAVEGVNGITDLMPGYWNLFIEFDPRLTSSLTLQRAVLERLSSATPAAAPREIVIPVRYDGADLPEIETLTGLTPAEIVALHSSRAYTVYAIGFTPGFPYLGTLDDRLRVPRLATPRAVTPANSVAIAGEQTGIYPLESPGGWRVLGTALERVFDATRAEPFLLQAGDRVRFAPTLTGDAKRATRPTSSHHGTSRGSPHFRVLEPGLHSSVQDLGRRMVGRFGLARAGAVDSSAHRRANALVGNASSAATLEMTLRGATLEVLADTVVAIAGGGMRPVLNGASAPMDSSFAVKRGDLLEFPHTHQGVRAYLAVRGGFVGEEVYGSASTDARAGMGGQHLETDAVLHTHTATSVRAGFAFTPRVFAGEPVLRVTPGPQAHLFPAEAWRTLTTTAYRVALGDRMGMRLEGNRLEASRFEIVSEGTPVGSVQVSSSGQPLLLLNDRGTLGGYAKIAVVVSRDLPRAAQLRPGERVRFALEGFSSARR
jgi:KipI family sensor histidine kinase inhibitor